MSRRKPLWRPGGTLREVRRLASRGWWYPHTDAEAELFAGGLPAIDRLISIHGPDARVADVCADDPGRESRPKGTDEVAPATAEQDGQLHGGDGASGEVQDSPPRPSDGSDDEANPEPCPGGTSGEATSPDGAPWNPREDMVGTAGNPEGEEPMAEQVQTEAAHKATFPTDKWETPSPSAHQGDSSDGSAGASPSQHGGACDSTGDPGEATDTVGAGDIADTGHNPNVGEASSPDAAVGSGDTDPETDDGESSASGSVLRRTSWGGVHADRKAAGRMARSPKARLAARAVQRELDRLVRACISGGQEETPRIDPWRLVKHLASRRGGLHRCHREEAERPVVLLLADVSGSCSVVAEPTLAACIAVAAGRDDVLVVEHSNGWPVAVYGCVARVCPPLPRPNEFTMSWWKTVISRCEIAGVVAFGDWDAADVYAELARRSKLWWLDSFAASMSPRPYRPGAARRRLLFRGWTGTLPVAYWCGVGSAEAAAAVLGMC